MTMPVPPLHTPEDLDFTAAECVRCGTVAPAAEAAIARGKEHLAAMISEHGDRVAGWRAIGWCDSCAAERDQWIEAMEALADGRATYEQTSLAARAETETLKIHRKIHGHALGQLDAESHVQVGSNTSRLFEACNRLMRANGDARSQMLNALAAHDEADLVERAARRKGPPPRWAGAHSFARVYEACDQGVTVEWVKDRVGTERLSGAGLIYGHAFARLDHAHPIVVPSRQVDALPLLSHAETYAIATGLRLPFPCIYLDFTDADGTIPRGEISITDVALEADDQPSPPAVALALCGALVWHHDDDEHPAVRIIPFSRNDDDDRGGAWKFETTGQLIINETDMLKATDMVVDDLKDVAAVSIRPLHRIVDDTFARRGYVLAGTPADSLVEYGRGPTGSPVAALETAMLHLITWALSSIVIRVLHFLDSANVDVVEQAAPMHRRDVKRATKRGWPIASSITIRHRITRGRRDIGGGDGHYRTRFEVAGHYNHVTRGSHVRCPICRGEKRRDVWKATLDADVGPVIVPGPGVYNTVDRGFVNAMSVPTDCGECGGTGLDPNKTKPCARVDGNGVRTCPDGCRREWVPPTVKGNPDAPLQVKTRRLPEP